MNVAGQSLREAFQSALALQQAGRIGEAEQLCVRILQFDPNHSDALHLNGVCCFLRGAYHQAAHLVSQALKRQPSNPAIWNSYGVILLELNMVEEAATAFDRSIRYKADYLEAFSNRGKARALLRQHDNALADYREVIRLNPAFVPAYVDAGNVCFDAERYEEALTYYNKAISLAPNHADAYDNLASVLIKLGRTDEAIGSLKTALELDPALPETRGHLLHLKMQRCEWEGWRELFEGIADGLRNNARVSAPFYMLPMPFTAEEQLKCSQLSIEYHYPRRNPAVWPEIDPPKEKIRIGYFSSDFGEHPVSRLLVGALEAHDRSRFEVIGFSFGRAGDQGAMRERIKRPFDRFLELSGRSDREIVDLSRQIGIDVAVDLNGHTSGGRTGAFAIGVAPIQVNFLGYPGTAGVEYMDYIIADRVVVPAEHRPYYSEHVVWLPECFQPNDSKKMAPSSPRRRSEYGLPDKAFVFCCFNNSYKITPDLFEVWMTLLEQVPSGVLWLLAGEDRVATNLKREAEQRGIDPDRLIFADRTNYDDYLARYLEADLFLDSWYFNAGTTASDALWSGLPVVTCLGPSFAGRMAGSLLNAIGLPELITQNHQEYKSLALELAIHPARLAEIKAKLVRHRASKPLFDTIRYTRHLEAAYSAMWARYQAGLPPDHIEVDALPA